MLRIVSKLMWLLTRDAGVLVDVDVHVDDDDDDGYIDEGWGRPDDRDEFSSSDLKIMNRAASIQNFLAEKRGRPVSVGCPGLGRRQSPRRRERQIEVFLRLLQIQWKSLRNTARGVSYQAKGSQKENRQRTNQSASVPPRNTSRICLQVPSICSSGIWSPMDDIWVIHSFTTLRRQLVAGFHSGGFFPNLDGAGQSYFDLTGIEYA
jgi:hypothetical protein